MHPFNNTHFLVVLHICYLIYGSNNRLPLFTNTVHEVVQVGLAGYQSVTLEVAWTNLCT